MEIKFLGGASEVGRSSFLVDSGLEKFLLDYGISVQEMEIPIQPTINLDGVIISHSHLDHMGLAPELYKRGYDGEVFLTDTTLAMSEILLYDAIKVQDKRGLKPMFSSHDIETFISKSHTLPFKKKFQFRESSLEFRNAGHIPGSSAPILETGGKRILYTGDIKFEDTTIMKKADQNYKDIDIVITESTYSYKNHPDRKKLADELREHIQDILYNDGIVLLPSFAVGRTQEILTLVHDLGFPVYLDGMGRKTTQAVLDNPSSVKDPDLLKKAAGKAHKIERGYERHEIVKDPCIIITTSGMLNGGPIHTYIKKLYNREDCSIVLTGYQVEGTGGRQLMDTGEITIEEDIIKLKMQMKFMDFSAHCGRDNLIKFLQKINPGKVIPVHGADTEEFAKELEKEGLEAYAPKNGETLKI